MEQRDDNQSQSILKPGAVITIKEVDFNSPKVQEDIRKIQAEQDRIISRKKIDIADMKRIVIDI